LIDVANLYQKEAYHSRLQPLIEAAKANTASLAVFQADQGDRFPLEGRGTQLG